MDNGNYNQELARYIWTILKNDMTIIWSWGIDPNTIKIIPSGLEFHVQGFIHTGMVRIELNEGLDLFEITLISEAGEAVKKIEEVYVDQLVSVIDQNVERINNYEERISQEYGFLKE